jgi:hypothetical protein
MFDGESMKSVTEAMTEIRYPFDAVYPFYVLLEASGSVFEHDQQVGSIPFSKEE